MYSKRTDLKLLNQIFKVLDIFDISKIDSRMIFDRTAHIENRNSSDYIDLLHNYCKYVNSDKFTHFGRFAKKMLLLNSLKEGDKFLASVIGIRFELNDPYISAIANLKKEYDNRKEKIKIDD